jgi:hypothetical protein
MTPKAAAEDNDRPETQQSERADPHATGAAGAATGLNPSGAGLAGQAGNAKADPTAKQNTATIRKPAMCSLVVFRDIAQDTNSWPAIVQRANADGSLDLAVLRGTTLAQHRGVTEGTSPGMWTWPSV